MYIHHMLKISFVCLFAVTVGLAVPLALSLFVNLILVFFIIWKYLGKKGYGRYSYTPINTT